MNPVMRRYAQRSGPLIYASAARSQTIRRRLGSVTLTGQGLGLGLGTSLFPVGAMEIKAGISAHNGKLLLLYAMARKQFAHAHAPRPRPFPT